LPSLAWAWARKMSNNAWSIAATPPPPPRPTLVVASTWHSQQGSQQARQNTCTCGECLDETRTRRQGATCPLSGATAMRLKACVGRVERSSTTTTDLKVSAARTHAGGEEARHGGRRMCGAHVHKQVRPPQHVPNHRQTAPRTGRQRLRRARAVARQ
jgi:hypothetical protein